MAFMTPPDIDAFSLSDDRVIAACLNCQARVRQAYRECNRDNTTRQWFEQEKGHKANQYNQNSDTQ